MTAQEKLPIAADREAAAAAVRDAHRDAEILTANTHLRILQLVNATFQLVPHDGPRGQKVHMGFDLVVPRAAYDEDTGVAGALFVWRLFADRTPGDVQSRMLEVTAAYRVVYGVPPKMREALVRPFVEQLGEFATYPYFRAHVAQASWDAGLQLPILPVISSSRRAPRRSGESESAPAVASTKRRPTKGRARSNAPATKR